ncbi:MAG TPA: ISAzo13 family transposase [Streptosporangiaceae bacterium]
MVVTKEMLAAKFGVIFPHLDERQRRLLMGAEARALGHGGIRLVARAAEVREATVSLGVDELEAGAEPLGRARRPGGGRKRAADVDPGLRPALLALVEPQERGDPMSPLRWTTMSTRKLAAELARQGHKVSADTVGGLLREEGFSLQANAKTVEGRRHPDRDAQFRYISEQVRAHQGTGDPVISVDAKKKELVGEFRNGGREWRPKGEPAQVSTHDFPDRELGKAIPYGVYDLAANAGWVNVGTDHDTAAFAVESIRRWWNAAGRGDYPRARRLLITADAGGSNGYRTRAWKTELAALAAGTGLEITVCHFPPGTSKWNKIEHRLFSHITMNWRGRPLTSHEVILNSIAATTTRTGLTVRAELDPGSYPTGTEISDAQMAAVPLARHRFHGDWNYTIHPRPAPPAPATGAAEPGSRLGAGVPDRVMLSHPALTGMSRQHLHDLIAELAEPQEAQREQARRQRRGTERRRAAGAGPRPKLTNADRILATVLYLRKLCTQAVLSELFAVDRSRLTEAIRGTRPLLEEHGHAITPATARFPAPGDLIAFLAAEDAESATQSKPAC